MLSVKSERAPLQRRSDRIQEKAMNTPSVYHASQTQTVIRQSSDFQKFTIDPINRAIDDNHVWRLAEAIADKNLLAEYPILVDSELRVIDGQHRLRAAEELGVPIYYIVSSKATVSDAAITTAVTKKWTAADYLNRYVAEGRAEYIKLSNFMNEVEFISPKITLLRDLCYYGNRQGLNLAFSQGKYICNDIPFARKVIKNLVDFGNYVSFYKDERFIRSIASLTANADYDHKRMMDKMSYLSARIVKCPDQQTYFERFNEVYNYHVAEKNKVTLRRLTSQDSKWRIDKKMALT